MPSDAGPAARHNTRHIGLPLRVNSSANTNRLERKQRVSQCDAVIDVDIGVDLEGLALGDAVVVAGRLSSSVRVVLFLGDRVERSIVPHRVQISTAAAQVSTLHCGQAIHHLLLRKIQVQVMALDEVALDLGDACKGPARSASALVLDIGDEDGRLGVIYAENCRNNIVQQSSLGYHSFVRSPVGLFGEAALLIERGSLHEGSRNAVRLAHSPSEVESSKLLNSQLREDGMTGRVILRVQFIVLLDSFLGLLVDHSSVGVFR